VQRRQFLASVARVTKGLTAGGLSLAALRLLRGRLVRAEGAPAGQFPIRPPGALPEAQFRATCIRCFICAEVCPVVCIEFPNRVEGAQPPLVRAPGAMERPATIAPVWIGDDTPYILPWKTACTACMKCGPACPTGALVPIANDRQTIKQQVRMGLAHIDRKICLPWTRRSWCGACLTACPYRGEAITVDHQGKPTVHPEHCIGCGLCVEVCPIRYKAIAVKPPFPPDYGEVRAE